MRKYFDTVLDVEGRPIVDAQITVTDQDGTPVTIYSENGGAEIEQPVLTNSLGYFEFFALDEIYAITFQYLDAPPRTIDSVQIFDDAADRAVTARALLLPSGETNLVVPPIAERAGKFWMWGGGGEPAVSTGSGGADPTLREDLAEDSGAGMIGVSSGGSVQSALSARPTWSALAESSSAAAIGTSDGANVQQAIAVAATPVDLIASEISLPVGATVRTADGHIYTVAPAIVTDEHVVTAGGVKLYVADPQITPDALGAPRTGNSGDDDAPYFERASQIDTTVHLVATSTYRLESMIGLPDWPDQTLYAPQALYLIGNGAKVVVASGEAVFTSRGAKDDPDSTANLYTGKVFITDVNFTQDGASVIFNGDRLYNLKISGCSFDGVDTVVKSFRAKAGGHPNGYIQSLIMFGSKFSECRRWVDAKRAYNVTVDLCEGEACAGGIYIDGLTEDPAVNSIGVTNCLFEGGGCFMVLGKVLAGTFSRAYCEKNTGGDAATAKCDIWLRAGPGPSSGIIFDGYRFDPHADQAADPDYVSIRIDYFATGAAPLPVLRQCWTSGTRLVTPGRAEIQGVGSNSATTFRNALVPASAVSARRATLSGTSVFAASTNLSAGVFRIASVDVQYILSLLSATGRATKGEISILMHHQTAAGVVNGASMAVIGFLLVSASEGIAPANAVNDVYANFFLKEFSMIPAGQDIDTLGAGAVTREHFASPVLSVDRVGNAFNLRLSNYSAPSNAGYGSADRITSHITIEADARNNGNVLTSPITLAS